MRRNRLIPSLAFVSTLLASNCLSAADEGVNFNRDVRPILSRNCFQCHGPDENTREAGLRLDLSANVAAESDSGLAAIVPNKPDQSELLRRVVSDDEQERMPPGDSSNRLSEKEVEVLRRWIEQGAQYQGHWAFIPPQRPELPSVINRQWPINEVDHFILAELETEGLSPTDAATKQTLIRRLSLDLTGTPPTPAEVDAFVADASPDAYERLVDRLQASPRYGERMAIHWLDAARFADSNGYQVDSSRQMWPWRDWLIKALNDNLPFDRFTVEQLAGDLLPDATESQRVATGFNRNHRLNGEGGIIAEEWRIETVIDRVETTGNTWMGLTLGCCRCHDHKFDPVSQKEFYQFFAFFNNIEESGTLQGESRNTNPIITVATDEQKRESAVHKSEWDLAQNRLSEIEKSLPTLVAAWETEYRQRSQDVVPLWTMLQPNEVRSTGGATLVRQSDGTWLASGNNPDSDTYEIVAPLSGTHLSALLLETLPHPDLPNQSLGRYSNGNYVLSGVEVEVSSPDLTPPRVGKLARVEADYSQKGWDIQSLLDDNPNNGWAVDGPTKRDPRRAIFVLDSPLEVPADGTVTVRLKHAAINGHNIGRFRISTSGADTEQIELTGNGQLPPNILAILELPPEKRSADQTAELEKFYREMTDNPIKRAVSDVAIAMKRYQDFENGLPTTMVMREIAAPRDTFILARGEYDKPGEQVTAATPAFLPPLPDGAPTDRLSLARWLVSPDHPLTARVYVNRMWEHFFGIGIVKSSENLGSQADWPSHPQLLDWLATEFVRIGWDMKDIQKKIVMSATYRQSSAVTPDRLQRDPENRLLARGPRFRLQAELIRDQALAISGLLNDKIGGPSVRPYMPEGVWNETTRYGDLQNYKHDVDSGLYRRTMYTIWKRTAGPPTLMLFDAPSREVCTVSRSRTNTPLQALAILNEVTYVEAARQLAVRMMTQGGSIPEDRLTHGFRLATTRFPESDELQILLDGLKADWEHYQVDTKAAEELISAGESKAPPDLNSAELAAYTLAANVILNLDEVITRE